jgi:hypothetical protein
MAPATFVEIRRCVAIVDLAQLVPDDVSDYLWPSEFNNPVIANGRVFARAPAD